MNNALIIGVILIIAGIALAVVAYMVITSSDEDDDDESELLEAVPSLEHAAEEAEPAVSSVTDSDDEQVESPSEPDIEISPSVEPALMDAPEPEPDEEPDHDVESPSEEIISDLPAGPPDRIQVATLMRDDVTGKLIIRVGDREYSSPEDLRASSDWTRVEYAASDLNKWIQTPEKKPPAATDSGAESEGQVAERQPSTIIEQINAILQERIETSGRSELAVRLIEGPSGMARVLIGVHSYEITEVPDPEVRELIREAVATWESTQ